MASFAAELASNIVLCGGTAMMPGFSHRLLEEVKARLQAGQFAGLCSTPSSRTVVTLGLTAMAGEPEESVLQTDTDFIL